MRTKKQIAVFLAVLACSLGLFSSTAFATKVYDYQDYANNNSANTVVTIHDETSWAGSGLAYNHYYVNGDGDNRVEVNADNTSKSSGVHSSGINHFNACQDRPFIPDPCSSYVYP